MKNEEICLLSLPELKAAAATKGGAGGAIDSKMKYHKEKLRNEI